MGYGGLWCGVVGWDVGWCGGVWCRGMGYVVVWCCRGVWWGVVVRGGVSWDGVCCGVVL